MRQHPAIISTASAENVAVLGTNLGALVDAVSFADRGYSVRLNVTSTEEADALRAGQTAFEEPGLAQQLVAAQTDDGLCFTSSLHRACHAADVVLLWGNGPDELAQQLEAVANEITASERFTLVAIRSLLVPGSMDRWVLPLLERLTGKACGEHYGLCYSPETVRPGVALADFRNPVRMLIGANDESSADVMASLLRWRVGSVCVESFATIEAVRMIDLRWQQTKIAFSAELQALCLSTGVARRAVINAFTRDSKQNISGSYLVPGSPVPEVLEPGVQALLTSWQADMEAPLPLKKPSLVTGG